MQLIEFPGKTKTFMELGEISGGLEVYMSRIQNVHYICILLFTTYILHTIYNSTGKLCNVGPKVAGDVP
jgi:hypothetical protein